MKSKSKKILARISSLLVVLIIGSGAICKLASLPALVEIFSKIGLLPYLQVLGIAELSFLSLFLWPRTMRTGFLLLTGYFGGAMAVELSHGTIFIVPACILSIVWISAYLRDTTIFSIAQQPAMKTRSVQLSSPKHAKA